MSNSAYFVFIVICITKPLLAEPMLHPDDSALLQYNKAEVESCLFEAESLINSHDEVYTSLELFIKDHDVRYVNLLLEFPRDEKFFAGASQNSVPTGVFQEFEGGWRGKWKIMPTYHVWFSIAWNIQLVIINDGGINQRGINYVHDDGAICGIVVEGNDKLRLHHGLFFRETDHSPEYLKWMIPGGNYYERVSHTPGETRIYHIEEQRFLGESTYEWGNIADYREWKND